MPPALGIASEDRDDVDLASEESHTSAAKSAALRVTLGRRVAVELYPKSRAEAAAFSASRTLYLDERSIVDDQIDPGVFEWDRDVVASEHKIGSEAILGRLRYPVVVETTPADNVLGKSLDLEEPLLELAHPPKSKRSRRNAAFSPRR
jgi:hypothetical protein